MYLAGPADLAVANAVDLRTPWPMPSGAKLLTGKVITIVPTIGTLATNTPDRLCAVSTLGSWQTVNVSEKNRLCRSAIISRKRMALVPVTIPRTGAGLGR